MRTVTTIAAAALIVAAGGAYADPWKDESGKGRYRAEYRDHDQDRDYRRHHAREYKEEYRQGGCKIERKWERGGGYKEEIKCDGKRR